MTDINDLPPRPGPVPPPPPGGSYPPPPVPHPDPFHNKRFHHHHPFPQGPYSELIHKHLGNEGFRIVNYVYEHLGDIEYLIHLIESLEEGKAGKLTITQGTNTLGEYDGSEDTTVDIPASSGGTGSIDLEPEIIEATGYAIVDIFDSDASEEEIAKSVKYSCMHASIALSNYGGVEAFFKPQLKSFMIDGALKPCLCFPLIIPNDDYMLSYESAGEINRIQFSICTGNYFHRTQSITYPDGVYLDSTHDSTSRKIFYFRKSLHSGWKVNFELDNYSKEIPDLPESITFDYNQVKDLAPMRFLGGFSGS